jgi:hypothetical protein
MTNPNDEFPEVRLSDVLFGDGFPEWGPRTPLSDAVIADGIARLSEFLTPVSPGGVVASSTVEYICQDCDRLVSEIPAPGSGWWIHASAADALACEASSERLKAQTRAAKEIRAAHADPHWLEP